MSITSLESLSNEFFYEIFDYLDGYKIYQSFYNLNHRFQQLLNSPSLLFKIQIGSSSEELIMNIYKQLILINKHQIISFHLGLPLEKSEFFSLYPIDSSFIRLESLSLTGIPPTILTSLLTNLTCLPRLFSLTINTRRTLRDLSEVYRLIFALPKLKYIYCSADESYISVSLPIATNEQLTNIEYLVTNHRCTFNELCTVISYTPQLCHLNLTAKLNESYSNIELILPIGLFNLTFISIQLCSIRDYLHADRWEELILEYLPQLKQFYLEYYEQIDPEFGSLTDSEPPNQFTSLFWIERQWVFEIETDTSDIIYSICSYKKRWYDINTPIELSKPTRLTLTNLPHDDYMLVLHIIFHDILIVAQIYHLEIFQKNIFSDTLLDIIHKLPALDSLKLSSLISPQSRWSSIDEDNLLFLSNKNNIKKVYLEEMNGMEEIYFLIRLCPRMTYLKVHLINNINYELVLKNILMKIINDRNQYLRLLCFHAPTADNKMIEKLQEMINHEKLLHHYRIKLELDNIYLQWK